jgi:CDP-paratose 2-epimerase
MFGIRTVVFRHSSMYGGRQFATYDQGWIGWFCQKAVETKRGNLKEPITVSGTGKQVRDVLYVDDMIAIYFDAVKKIDSAQGQAFNIGGGVKNSLSLIELFLFLEKELDIQLNYINLPARESDQRVFIANISKAKRCIGWEPTVGFDLGISQMINWVSELS